MTVLVTGATGLVGNNVVRALLEDGRRVRALVRSGSDPRPLDGLDVERAVGDVRDAGSVVRAVAGASLVVHAAGLVGIGRRGLDDFRAVNLGGTLNVATACRDAAVRMVHVSSVDTLPFGTRAAPADEDTPGTPPLGHVPYMASKREAEAAVLGMAHGGGLDAVVANPGFVLGPWDWRPSSGRLLLAVARGAGLVAPPGGNDFCHAADVATGVLAAAERGRTGERYVLSGEALAYREAFALFARITGGPAPVLTAPAALIRGAGAVGDLVAAVTGREPDLNSASAEAACMPHHFSSRRAREELGYSPRPAEAAARDAWRWFGEHGYR